jgi:hypothetical protein
MHATGDSLMGTRLLLLAMFVACALACSRSSPEPAAAAPALPPTPKPLPASAEAPWLDDPVAEIDIAVRRSEIHECDSFRYRPLAEDPEQYEIKCDRDDRIYNVKPTSGEVQLVDSGSYFSRMHAAAASADPSDRRRAANFLASLPPACASSSMGTRSDGTIVISLTCAGTAQGSVHIKDGVVTRMQ